MRKFNTILFILFILSVMLYSNAIGACSTTRCDGTIERLYIHSGLQRLYVSTDGDETNLNCSSPNGVYITVPTDHTEFKNVYAMLLTAVSLNKPVALRIKEESAICELDYAYINNFD